MSIFKSYDEMDTSHRAAYLLGRSEAERERIEMREKWKASEREVGRLAGRLADVERDSEVAFGQLQGFHVQADALATISDLAADWTDDDLTVLQLRARLKSIASIVYEQAQEQRS